MTKQMSKAFLWASVGRSPTGYRFALSRGGDVPVSVIGDSSGASFDSDSLRVALPELEAALLAEIAELPLGHIPQRHRPRAELFPAHELQVDDLR